MVVIELFSGGGGHAMPIPLNEKLKKKRKANKIIKEANNMDSWRGQVVVHLSIVYYNSLFLRLSYYIHFIQSINTEK